MKTAPPLVRATVLAATLALMLSVDRLASADDPPAARPPRDAIRGIWLGMLKTAKAELRISTTIRSAGRDSLTATLNSLDQDGVEHPVDEVAVKDATVRIVVKAFGLTYEGTLNAAGTEIVGRLEQRGATLPVVFKKVDRAPEPRRRPQDPKRPLPYREVEVTFENPAAPARFTGTLTLPASSGRLPAVLLISGSGQQDRNEALAGHRPFLVLADYLTRRGIAVLRVDDRGVGGSTGDVAHATSEDFAGDAIAAIAYLKTRSDIDARRIGLIGHSEGGLIAPMVAVRDPDVALIVLLAGPGVPGDQLLRTQAADLLKQAGVNPIVGAISRGVQGLVLAAVKREARPAGLEKPSGDQSAGRPRENDEKPAAKAGTAPDLAHTVAQAVSNPWLQFFVAYDPRPTLRRVRCPVLALNGEKDIQVAANENLSEIEKALRAGGSPDFSVRALPSLNHLFQTCRTGNIDEYARIDETIAPSALQLVGDWLRKRFKIAP